MLWVGNITAILLTRRQGGEVQPHSRGWLLNTWHSQDADFGLFDATLKLVVCYFSLHSVILLEVLRFKKLVFTDPSAKP